MNLPRDEARKRVMDEDDKRRTYVKRYFGKRLDDASLYDIVINSGSVVPQRTVMIIGNMLSLPRSSEG